MSVIENLQMGAFIRSAGEKIDDDVARVYDLFPRLRERRSQKAGTLSGGEQQMLAMGRALMARPRSSCWTSRRWASRRSWPSRSSQIIARSMAQGDDRAAGGAERAAWR